mmetsp:Transcript_26718/g.49026  ORF Transcript_26718/g.49026 Transcript_26718/m.49026 type:complete len:440 (+) Transcript_26718:57-1376(+)
MDWSRSRDLWSGSRAAAALGGSPSLLGDHHDKDVQRAPPKWSLAAARAPPAVAAMHEALSEDAALGRRDGSSGRVSSSSDIRKCFQDGGDARVNSQVAPGDRSNVAARQRARSGEVTKKIVEMAPLTPRDTPPARAKVLEKWMQSSYFNEQAAGFANGAEPGKARSTRMDSSAIAASLAELDAHSPPLSQCASPWEVRRGRIPSAWQPFTTPPRRHVAASPAVDTADWLSRRRDSVGDLLVSPDDGTERSGYAGAAVSHPHSRNSVERSALSLSPAGLASRDVPQLFDDSFRSPVKTATPVATNEQQHNLQGRVRPASAGSSARASPANPGAALDRSPSRQRVASARTSQRKLALQDRPSTPSRIVTPDKQARRVSSERLSPQVQMQLRAKAKKELCAPSKLAAGQKATQKSTSSTMLGVRQQKLAATAVVQSFGRSRG